MKRQSKSNNEKITAAYCRLSSDDKDERNGIATQKKIITTYAEQNGFKNLKWFINDGVTGTRFDRPGYESMLEEIEAGNVETLIVKDLSRVGRDHLRVGLLMEKLPTTYNIRFIAMGDNVDSAKGYDDLVPIKFLLPSTYLRSKLRSITADLQATS